MTTTTEKILTAIEQIHNSALQAVKHGLPEEDAAAITQAVSAAITSLTTLYRISVDSVECAGCQMDLLDALRARLLECVDIVESDMNFIAEENDFEQVETMIEPDAPLLH